MKMHPNKYPPGSKWLYIKIYGGPQALEEWLINRLRAQLSEWKKNRMVEQFHFIHYLDPGYHLRLRFLLDDPVQSGILLHGIQSTCQELLEEDLIWKIEVCTYEPEYERYGLNRMSVVEAWFELDSLFWLDEIHRHAGIDNPDIWKNAMRSVDVFLTDFGANNDDKVIILKRLKNSAANLFGMSRRMQMQLDDKYRKMAFELIPVIGIGTTGSDPNIIDRSAKSKVIFAKLRGTFRSQTELLESNLLPDLIHISLNRAFRTRHRMQELVLYDFLGRYYESVRARGNSIKSDA